MPVRDALIVAMSGYADAKLRQLRAPATDAERLRTVLEDPAIGGFRVAVASDESEGCLRRRLARFFSNRAPDDLLVLHFSCHGVKDDKGELYLAAVDTDSDPDLLSATGIASGWLNDQIGRCRSKRIVVFLDCCFSGSFPLGMQARAGDAVDVGGHLGGRGRVVVTASNAMEYAFEGDQLSGAGQPSIFTGALVEALATGRADRDGDGRISIDELYDYVYDRVRERAPGQTPTKLSTLEGPLYIAGSSYKPPVAPASLDTQILHSLESHLAGVRLGAVEELSRLLTSSDAGLALAARQALERMVDDDSRAVAARVAQALDELQEDEDGQAPSQADLDLDAPRRDAPPPPLAQADAASLAGPDSARTPREVTSASGTSRTAIAALAFGIASPVFLAVGVQSESAGVIFTIFALPVTAIALGLMARHEIRRTTGLAGASLALAGIAGGIATALVLLVLVARAA